MNSRLLAKGFTVVELLIVIVVIAILAVISIVSYNGIKERANETAVKTDLTNNRDKLLEYKAATGRFPSLRSNINKGADNCDGTPAGQVSSSGWYCPIISNGASGNFNNSNLASSDGQSFTLTIGKGSRAYTINEEGVVTSQSCSVNSGQSATSGYSSVYSCPSGSVTYSQ